MADDPRLILEVARGGAVERQLGADAPRAVADGEVAVVAGPADAEGHLDPPAAGEVVLSVPSPEALTRDPGEVRRVIAEAGTGTEPLVVVVQAAEELRDDELAVVLDAAGRSSRPVILRALRDA
jgi:hypothetical protein